MSYRKERSFFEGKHRAQKNITAEGHLALNRIGKISDQKYMMRLQAVFLQPGSRHR